MAYNSNDLSNAKQLGQIQASIGNLSEDLNRLYKRVSDVEKNMLEAIKERKRQVDAQIENLTARIEAEAKHIQTIEIQLINEIQTNRMRQKIAIIVLIVSMFIFIKESRDIIFQAVVKFFTGGVF